MSAQEEIAQRIAAANDAVLEAVRAASPVAWRHPVGDGDTRSVATLAHHIGMGYEHALRWAESIQATGRMPELSQEGMDAENAEHAVEYASPSKLEVEEWLTAECAELCELAQSVSDEELETLTSNYVFGRQWSLREVFETTLRHTARHLEQLRAAIAAATGT